MTRRIDNTPMPVVGLANGVVGMGMGSPWNTCVRMADDGVRCWGDNTYGQIGDGTTTMRLVPVGVLGFAGTPTSITAVNGSGQSAAVNSAFAVNLQALVTDSVGTPVQGASVTFTLPASGASGKLSAARQRRQRSPTQAALRPRRR